MVSSALWFSPMRKDVSDLVQLGLGLGAAAVVAGILWKLKRRSEGAQPSVTKKDGGRREVTHVCFPMSHGHVSR